MKSKEELKEWFEKVTQKKQTEGLRISKDLNELFCFMDSNIKRDLESFNILSFTICGSSGRNYKVSPEMQSAFSACTLFERI